MAQFVHISTAADVLVTQLDDNNERWLSRESFFFYYFSLLLPHSFVY